MRRWLTRPSGDDAFTLVEMLVTMVIIAVALLGLMTIQVRALETVTLAKQRQQATALANRTMEQLRALPYETVTAGLRVDSLGLDPNIDSSTGRLRPAYASTGIDEIIVAGTSASVLPLFPHRQTSPATSLGNVQYTVSTYVTLASGIAGNTAAGYWLTVVVTWASEGTQKTVSDRSRLFSPSGCLATATHPFPGPCQAFFDGTAGTTPAGISLTSAGAADSPLVVGNDLRSGNVALPGVSAGTQAEQTVSASAKAATSGAGYEDVTPGDDAVGQVAATNAASTDPASGTGSNPPATTVTQSSPFALTEGTAGSTFTLQAGSTDSGRSASTTGAVAGGACKDLADASVTTGQTCASSNVAPGGVMAATLTHGTLIPLASVAPSTTAPTRAFSSRYLAPSGGNCTGTSGSGCVSANAVRALGAIALGGVPAGAGPAGFTSMVRLVEYSDRAGAASGVGVQAGSTGSTGSAGRTGTLQYWTGAAYASVDLATAGPTGPTALGPVTVTYPGPGSVPHTLSMTGSVSVRPLQTTPSGSAPCQPAACGMTASAESVTASVTYRLQVGDAVVGDFTVGLDLGSTRAQTSYRAAPGA